MPSFDLARIFQSYGIDGALQPYIESHPWTAPLIAACIVLGWFVRILFAIWGNIQKERRMDHVRSIALLEACKDQRNIAMKDAENWRRRAEKAEAELDELRSNHDGAIPFRRKEILDTPSRSGDRAG